MNTLCRSLCALALTLLATAVYADPPGRVARLNYASGAVSFAPAEAQDQWQQAVVNRPLTDGDRLWADRNGYAELHIGSTAIRLAPLTSLDILRIDDGHIQLRLAQGNANLRVRDVDPDELIELATPAGAVVVSAAGSYRLSAEPDTDVVRVRVNFGRAELATPTRKVAVPTGQTAVIADTGQISFELASRAATDGFDEWSAERDRREDRVQATQYVSPHMTGYEDLDLYGTWETHPEYGAVWVPTRVASGWAPYREGHWAWVSPWGWTWIDDAPWGFAPFHYGRWVHVQNRWAWAPGPAVRRPVYAPALVAFVGGSSWAVAGGSGPAVGWFPLGWREPYRPWYRASEQHVSRVNVYNTTVVRHVYRNRPEAITAVSRQSFAEGGPVSRERVRVRQADLAAARLVQEQSALPARASFASSDTAPRPTGRGFRRETVNVPAPAASNEARERRFYSTPAARPTADSRTIVPRGEDELAERREKLRTQRLMEQHSPTPPRLSREERIERRAANRVAPASPQAAPSPRREPVQRAAPTAATNAPPARAPRQTRQITTESPEAQEQQPRVRRHREN